MTSSLLALLAVLPVTLLAVDPTTVCMPPQVEFNGYSSKDHMESRWAIDFNKGLLGGGGKGWRLVQDITRGMEYITTGVETFSTPLVFALANSTCFSRPTTNLPQRCLSANATLASTIRMGYGSGAIEVQVWEFPQAGGVARQGFQLVGDASVGQQYALPVFNTEPQIPDQVNIITSVKTSISDPLFFQVPNNCPPKQDVVG